MTNLRRHLSPANVLSCLALFVALSGVAYGATLAKNAVKSRNIAKNAVTTPKLKKGAVTTQKLRNGAVTGPKLANEAVVAEKLAKASVRSVALGGGVVTTAKLKDLAVTEGKLGNGAVTTAKLGAGSVETGKLAKEAVTSEKIAAGLLAQLVKSVDYMTETSKEDATEAPKTISAQCPAGKEVIGGGARVTGNGDVAVTESAPVVDSGGKHTGWRASARVVNGPPEPWAIEAHAICAEL
jgi:hypothetical protein